MKPWFKAKEYGWGWYPVTWQAWLVMFAWLGASVYIFRDIDSMSHSGSDTLISFFLPFAILTGIFFVICWKTGERPSWRWGKKTETK